MHEARAFGYELVCLREGETSVVSIRHSLVSPAGLKSAVVFALLVVVSWLCTSAAVEIAERRTLPAAVQATAIVAVLVSVLAVQVPKRLMLMFGSQSLRASSGQLAVRQDCVVWSRVVVLDLQAGYVAPSDRGWFRRYWEESVWLRPGAIGGISVHGANGVEIARFGVGISRRAAERLCGGGRIELFDSQQDDRRSS